MRVHRYGATKAAGVDLAAANRRCRRVLLVHACGVAMAHVHGRVAGSKPQHKVGDKSVVLLGRTSNPPVRESHVEAGFERFFGCKEPTGTLNRKPITWQHQDVHSRPKGRRYLEPTKHEDRHRGTRWPGLRDTRVFCAGSVPSTHRTLPCVGGTLRRA